MLVIIGAGDLQVPAIKKAKQMGFGVIATDINPNAPGFKFCDYRIIKSTKDFEGTISELRQYSNYLKGILTVGSDVSITVARLPNISNYQGFLQRLLRFRLINT
ncbi:MAG: hypothetical protein V1872_09795 [bacterium]